MEVVDTDDQATSVSGIQPCSTSDSTASIVPVAR